jgi:DNA-binding MarR family transcriptional regulator
MTTDGSRLRPLLERLARVTLAEDWADGLNPPQAAALRYLARANRFSRAPSQVAAYLGATRGTVSQTLAVLARKGLVAEAPVDGDRRRVRLDLTPAGRAALDHDHPVDQALRGLDADRVNAMESALKTALAALLRHRGARPFGLCRDCRHHAPGPDGARCMLLEVALDASEAEQICHEQVPA